MHVTTKRYGEGTEDDRTGTIYSFTEGDRTYLFDIVDRMGEWASAHGAVLAGRAMKMQIQEPYGRNDTLIGIPRTCPVFQAALRELVKMGVRKITVYNRVSGGYPSLDIATLQS